MQQHSLVARATSLVLSAISKLCAPNEKAMQLKRIVEPYSPRARGQGTQEGFQPTCSHGTSNTFSLSCTNSRARASWLSYGVRSVVYYCGKISFLVRNEFYFSNLAMPTCCIASIPHFAIKRMYMEPRRPQLIRILAARGKFFISAFPSRSAV